MYFSVAWVAHLFSLQSFAILAQAETTLYFPPADGSPDQIANWQVHSGDTFNVTWNVDFSLVKIIELSSAPSSNFTSNSVYEDSQPPLGNFSWVLFPDRYLINDSSTEISSYFRLEDSDNSSQYVQSQNFTILQPAVQSIDSTGGFAIPADASTWTGSATVFNTAWVVTDNPSRATSTLSASIETGVISTATQPTPHIITSSPSFASPTATGNNSSLATPANSASPPPPPETLSPGLAAAVALGAFVFLALVLNMLLLVRRRRETVKIRHRRPELP